MEETKKIKRIKCNCAQCDVCGEILISKYRHDFKQCKCGNIFVDGGNEYLRRGAVNWDFFKELSTLE